MGWLHSANGVFGHILGNRGQAEVPQQPDADLLIVRRGLSPAFYFFCHVFAKEHSLQVLPDRRATERRQRPRLTAAFDRRASERRERATQWRKEDFIVVRKPQGSSRWRES